MRNLIRFILIFLIQKNVKMEYLIDQILKNQETLFSHLMTLLATETRVLFKFSDYLKLTGIIMYLLSDLPLKC